MNIVNMKITDIRPYEKNPRHNEAAVEAVSEQCIWHSPSGAQPRRDEKAPRREGLTMEDLEPLI